MLVYYAMVAGLKAHHVVIWGALIVIGLLPVWDGAEPSNVGLLITGAAVVVNGVLDHRLLVRTFGPATTARSSAGNAGG